MIPIPTTVYCVLCTDPENPNPNFVVHIFSSPEAAAAFAKVDSARDHVFYDYLIDHPERMEFPWRPS